MKSYIDFELIAEKPKTSVFSIVSKRYGDELGIVKWYAPWRQYCFFPSEETIWNRGCLREVNEFIQKLMDERKKRFK